MALTFSEGVAVATLVFTILAVLFVVPYVIVAFGFFPESGFASRFHPSNSAILRELAAMRKDIENLRKNSGSELEWSEIKTDTLLTIGEKLKENMD
jgi:hypothetical protein